MDNGSSDNSLDFIKNNSFNFPVRIIENSENLGFSPAVNQGIREAKYEYIFSLNNDTEVKEGSIKALVDLMSSDDKIFSAQAKMLQYSNKDLIDDVGDEYNLLHGLKREEKITNPQNLVKFVRYFQPVRELQCIRNHYWVKLECLMIISLLIWKMLNPYEGIMGNEGEMKER